MTAMESYWKDAYRDEQAAHEKTRGELWRSWPTPFVVFFGLLGVAVGLGVGVPLGRESSPPSFVERVLDEYPGVSGQASDVFAYGWASCAGLVDGWTVDGVAGWLSGTPYDTLGPGGDRAAFGRFVVEAAVETLCPE